MPTAVKTFLKVLALGLAALWVVPPFLMDQPQWFMTLRWSLFGVESVETAKAIFDCGYWIEHHRADILWPLGMFLFVAFLGWWAWDSARTRKLLRQAAMAQIEKAAKS